MSLIHDALKRAKQTQEQNPPAIPPLQFQPVGSGAPNHRAAPLLLVGLALLLVLVVALGGMVLWLVAQKSAADLRVAARPAVEPTPARPADSPVGIVPAGLPATPPSSAPADPGSNAPTVAGTVETPPPLALKLQGITFHPSRPVAVLNGRTVVVGDRVGGFRVLAITRGSVTLGAGATTNVLSLSE